MRSWEGRDCGLDKEAIGCQHELEDSATGRGLPAVGVSGATQQPARQRGETQISSEYKGADRAIHARRAAGKRVSGGAHLRGANEPERRGRDGGRGGVLGAACVEGEREHRAETERVHLVALVEPLLLQRQG